MIYQDFSTRIEKRSLACLVTPGFEVTLRFAITATFAPAIGIIAAETFVLVVTLCTAVCRIAFARGAALYAAGLVEAYGGRFGLPAILCGITMSSINRNSSGSSPFNTGRGPRNGKLTTFHGHSGGIIHSTTYRFGWPFPSMSPALSTLYPRA